MARFLTTLPSNSGFYNLGTVEAYPTGGSGPTAYGPTSYFGSDPLPERRGDSVNNPLYLGDFSSGFKSTLISNTHGGNTRVQSTFYKFNLSSPRTVQLTQNYSPTSYQANTNRNTLVSAYYCSLGNCRKELPINNQGYICKEASITEDDSYSQFDEYIADYPIQSLDAGDYLLLVTNDIRYLETTYSFTLSSILSDWRFVSEPASSYFSFGLTIEPSNSFVDFGLVRTSSPTSAPNGSPYPYSDTSGLGYTRAGVSP